MAVEAVEGTDEAIVRGGQLAKDGAVGQAMQAAAGSAIRSAGRRPADYRDHGVCERSRSWPSSRPHDHPDRDLTLQQAKSARIAVVGIVKPPPQSGRIIARDTLCGRV